MKDFKLIISQRYVQKTSGLKASLIDLQGGDALVQNDSGKIEKMDLNTFKSLYTMAA